MHDFSALSSFDFELLCADLLGRALGVRFEVFTPGRDGGIDLRHLQSTDTSLVVQCKHWLRSGWSSLRSHLENVEAEKVRTLSPDRYLIATSVPMTPDRKAAIYSLFADFMESSADVHGPEDLNGLLREFPDVEQSHFKLWLSSTAVLDRVLHSGIHTATEHAVAEIERRVTLYVPGDAYAEARAVLDEHHSCIIAGLPGVGKTMLADMLLYTMIGEGYSPFVLRQDVAEADDVYRPDLAQVFLYDDFLGQTASVEKLAKNEDARLAEFMDRVGRADNKRFVLTTREYILQQGRRLYARLNEPEFDANKYVLRLSQYSRFDKAKILYNHLHFSDLPRATQLQILEDDAYLTLIDHRNYNPRLIEYVVKLATLEDIEQTLPEFLLTTLDQPETLWRHAVESQLGDLERVILLVMCTLPPEVRLAELVEAASSHANSQGLAIGSRAIQDALRVLEDTFIRVGSVRSGPSIAFHNASIRDFLLSQIDSDPMLIADLVDAATRFEQVELLHRYGRGVHWHYTETREFGGIEAWFAGNGEKAAQRLVDLFQSPVGHYIRVVDREGLSDLRPERSLEARLATILEISRLRDVDLSDWMPSAIAILRVGWRRGVGDREGWARVLRAVDAEASQELFATASADAHAWFFEEMYGADDFFAYTSITEDDPWWLPPDHKERIRETFSWFAESELHWIISDVDDPDTGSQALEAVKSLADDLGVELDDRLLREAEEALWRFGDPEDSSSGGHGSHGAASSSGDIASLFGSL